MQDPDPEPETIHDRRARRARRLRLLGWASLPFVAFAGISYALLGVNYGPQPAQTGAGPATPAPEVAVVQTVLPQSVTTPVAIDLRGVVAPAPEAPVTVPQVARVAEVSVRPGQQVRAGDVLALIEPPDDPSAPVQSAYRNVVQSVQSAQAQFAAARANMNAAEGAVTLHERQMSDAKTDLAAAQDSLKQAVSARDLASAAVDKQQAEVTANEQFNAQGALSRQALEGSRTALSEAQTELRIAEEGVTSAREQLRAAEDRLREEQEALANARSAEGEARVEVQALMEKLGRAQTRAANARNAVLEFQRSPRRAPLRSPAEGIVTSVGVKPRMLVTPAMPVVNLKMTGIAVVRAEVPVDQAIGLKKGAPAAVRGSAGAKALPAKVAALESDAGAAPTRIALAVRDPKGTLKPSAKVNATISLSEGQALAVPRAALVPRGEKKIGVWVVENGAAHMCAVKIGRVNQENAIILDGVQPQASVIVSTSAALNEGMHVRMTPDRPAQKPATPSSPARLFP